MPAAAAFAIPAVTSIASGFIGSGAAKKGANLQQQMAQQQAQQFQSVLNQYNPAIGDAASWVNAAAQKAGENLTGVAGQSAAGLNTAAGNANALLAPWLQAGQGAAASLADLMAPGGALSHQFTAEDMKTLDPGYQFRIDMANKMAQQSAAARGGALGGGTLQALASLNQNLASSEMQNAFTRFQTQQQNRFSNLYNLAGLGQNAANVSGANLMNAAQVGGGWLNNAASQAGGWNIMGSQAQQNAAEIMAQNAMRTQQSIADMMTGGAAAKAAGMMGSANAWGNALGGVGQASQEYGKYLMGENMLEQAQQGQPTPGFQPYSGAPPYMPTPALPAYSGPTNINGILGPAPALPYNYTYGPFAPQYMAPGYMGTYGGY